jgi:broad specificity phosphatase PhoE
MLSKKLLKPLSSTTGNRKMTNFYICRHGESENNKLRRLSGWIDTPLTELGRTQAQTVAEKLQGVQIEQIIASDLGRAFTTAYIIARGISYTGEIITSKELREVNYGELANQPYHAYPDLSPEDNTNFVPPGGESLQHMQDRVLAYLVQLADRYAGKSVLIVAHDGTINALRANFTDESMGQADQTHNPHDAVITFTLEDGRVQSYQQR